MLCPKGFYNDQAKKDECKVCDAAGGGEEVCTTVPGATSQTGGAKLPEEYMFVVNASSSLIDAALVIDLDDSETTVGKKDEELESTKYSLYYLLAIPPLSIVLLHRYLPPGFKKLDFLFAGSHAIDDTVSFSG